MGARKRTIGAAVLWTAAAVAAAAPAAAHAADGTFRVTSTADSTSDPADVGACASGGACTLRQAITAAAGGGTIELPAGQYVLTNGELTVAPAAALTIAGAGAGATAIRQQTDARRVLSVSGGPVAISGVEISGGSLVGETGTAGVPGHPGFPGMPPIPPDFPGVPSIPATPGGPGGPGGPIAGAGIANTGTLTLTDVVVTTNHVLGGSGGIGGMGPSGTPMPAGRGGDGGSGTGGGIANHGTLTLERVRVTGNRAVGGTGGNGGSGGVLPGGAGSGGEGSGGGIVNSGTLVVRDSTVSGNEAVGGFAAFSPPGFGGGATAGDATGGGIAQLAGTLTVSGSTVAGNRALGGSPDPLGSVGSGDAHGGGLRATAPFTLVASTLAGNTAIGGTSPAFMLNGAGSGGGISATGGGALRAVTLAGNRAEATTSAGGAAIPAGTGGNVAAPAGAISALDVLIAGGDAAIGANCVAALGDVRGSVEQGPSAECGATAFGDLLLGTLGDHGGPTATIVPRPSSPVLGAGVCGEGAEAVAFDQRGLPRPKGRCDAGAVQVTLPLPDGRDGGGGVGGDGGGGGGGDGTGDGGRPGGGDGSGGDRTGGGGDGATVAPQLTKPALAARVFLVRRVRTVRGRQRVSGGTTVRFTLDRAATVRLRIATVPARGRRARTIGTISVRGRRGANRAALTGRVGRRTLAPGRYRLTLTPVADGRSGSARTLDFTIRRG
jgi:hypothetical protein